ncbi:retinol dehydrogenase 9 precursor [Xenopus laevis]|uniref:Rdh9 protein n=1 Tax=Xenopus laevis TaxID=8355 RepID=Q0IHE1_XENLA|nr:retinol dehydrogenase 9 precursor [Xenopus laevis]AAI23192.1 Rdh9 protein [Xenopus laevis]
MWLPLMVLVVLIFLYRWNRQRQILPFLTDKYVFITGCDSGFGNVLAKQLDRRGLRVLAACLTDKGAEELKKETSSRLRTIILDISDSQMVTSVTEWITNTVGNEGLWGLVNNAGIGLCGPNGLQRKEDFAKVLEVNLLGTIDVTLHLLPLIRRSRGRIVNVSSGAGRLAVTGGGYCLSKYGVEAFSDSLRREMYNFGVKVSIIEPGAFRTQMSQAENLKMSLTKLWEALPQEIKESYGEQYIQQQCHGLDKLVEYASPNLTEVTDCMEHALTAVFPWTRYSPGWDSKLYFIPLSYLPTAISDYVLLHSTLKTIQTTEKP